MNSILKTPLQPHGPPLISLLRSEEVSISGKNVPRVMPDLEASAQESPSWDLANRQMTESHSSNRGMQRSSTDDSIYDAFIAERPEVTNGLEKAVRHYPEHATIIEKTLKGFSLLYNQGITNVKNLLEKNEIFSSLKPDLNKRHAHTKKTINGFEIRIKNHLAKLPNLIYRVYDPHNATQCGPKCHGCELIQSNIALPAARCRNIWVESEPEPLPLKALQEIEIVERYEPRELVRATKCIKELYTIILEQERLQKKLDEQIAIAGVK